MNNKIPKTQDEIQNLNDERDRRFSVFQDKIDSQNHKRLFERDNDGVTSLSKQVDQFDTYLSLCESTSSVSQPLQRHFLRQISNLRENPTPDFMDAAIAFLHASKPKDEIETMLIAQMFLTHNLTMTCGSNMARCEEMEINNQYVGRISRLSKAFRENLEALNKHRGKGQQKVTVEHVHVHEGGQAIVGNMETGGGANGKR